MSEKGMTVGELIQLLSGLPSDREVYVKDDSIEYPMNRVVPEYDVWAGIGSKTKTAVLITWDLSDD